MTACWSCEREHPADRPCMVGAVLVCGGRDYGDARAVYRHLDALARRVVLEAVVHGDAAHWHPGADPDSSADRLAGRWAAERGVPVYACPADWSRGAKAGPERNAAMLARHRPVCVVAFPGGKGTANMVELAQAAGVPVWDLRERLPYPRRAR